MTNEIINYISSYQNMPIENIKANSHLVKDLGMSSLDLMQLLCAVEEQFEVEFDEDDLLDLLTVDKLAVYIKNKIKK